MVRMLLGEDGGWGENCILLKMWLRLEKRSDEELYFSGNTWRNVQIEGAVTEGKEKPW